MRSRPERHVRVALGQTRAASVLAGCASAALREAPPGDLAQATLSVDSEAEPVPQAAPRTAALVRRDDPDIQAALRAWKGSGEATIIRNEGFILYPYRLSEAGVASQPLRACDVALEAGGEITTLSLGDSTRWLAARSPAAIATP